jgi:hypothetical protein
MTNKVVIRFKGGPGSGDFGHAGRPGEVGGSAGGDVSFYLGDHTPPKLDRNSLLPPTPPGTKLSKGQFSNMAEYHSALKKINKANLAEMVINAYIKPRYSSSDADNVAEGIRKMSKTKLIREIMTETYGRTREYDYRRRSATFYDL